MPRKKQTTSSTEVRRPSNNPEGRPKKKIDWGQVEYLCEIGCTQSEIAAVLRMDKGTLALAIKDLHGVSFPEYRKMFSEVGKSNLRRWQENSAKKGNPQMLKFLGINRLNQSEKSKKELSNDKKLIELSKQKELVTRVEIVHLSNEALQEKNAYENSGTD